MTKNVLFCLLLASSSFAGEVLSDAQTCKASIALAARKVPLVGARGGCNVVDPACASLQKSAHAIGDIQKSVLAKCIISAENHCLAYEEHLKAGMPAPDAWMKAMHSCSPGIEEIPPSFFPCICKLDKSGSDQDRPGFNAPRPQKQESTDVKLN